MNSKDVILVKIYRVALVKLVKPGFVQRVVHDTLEPLAVTLRDSRPKVFAPSS